MLDSSLSINASALATEAMRRCDLIAAQTESAGKIHRTFCSSAVLAAHQLLRAWMQASGMECRLDSATNLFGLTKSTIQKPKILIGSHIDTVPNGGKYDGALGIILGLATIESFGDRIAELPFQLEVVAFSEEEGVRFRSPYIGSKALAGTFDYALLDRKDDAGLTVREALRTFGGDPDQLASSTLNCSEYVAFIEPHIEQGPILESNQLALGAVEGIAGQTRATARFLGRASHAGTTPMSLRFDAMAAAASWIVAVEEYAKTVPGLVATVGFVQVSPNVPNVIPGEVGLRLDVRHLDDSVRQTAAKYLEQAARTIADKRKLEFHWERCEEQTAVLTDEQLTQWMVESVEDVQGLAPRLHSGAGHDAVVMSPVIPTTMLFLRCKEGISHHPEESVKVSDVELAIRVLHNFICRLAAKHKQLKTYPKIEENRGEQFADRF